MKNHALMAALMAGAALSACPPASAQVTRYYGEMRTSYSDFQDRTACPLGSHGSCQDFPRTARLAGWFETAAPLQPNLDESEIRALVTSYSFSDGLNTYSSSDPDVRAFIFRVSTDSGSNIVRNRIHLQRWLTGNNPHRSINQIGPGGSTNDVDMLSRFEMATEQVGAMNNAMCASLFSETSQQVSYSGESDTCLGTYEIPGNGVSVAWTGAPVQNQNVMSWHREAVHPALSLTHSISPAGQVQAGQEVRYTITVRNTGTVPATQAQIADSLPAGLERATWTCTPGASTPCPVASGSGSLAVTVPVFAAGDSLVFTVMASVSNPAPATITNVATVDAGDPSVQCMQAGQVVGTVPCMASASINTVAAPPGGGQVTPVPTLQHAALVVLSLLAAAIGWMGLGRRQRVGAGR